MPRAEIESALERATTPESSCTSSRTSSSQEDYGVYDVVVSNPCGPVTSGRTSVTPPVGAIEQWSSLPEPRAFSAMAFDRGRGRMVLHGGWWETLTPENYLDAFNVTNQTWERDAMGLWQFATNQGPSARYGHAMAYDEARGVTVLFGGYLCEDTLCSPGSPGGAVAYNDTWEWDGTTWTERVVANPPPARWMHAMAYDSVRQRVVVFGGRSTNPSAEFLGDLWEWDGTTASPSIAPARSSCCTAASTICRARTAPVRRGNSQARASGRCVRSRRTSSMAPTRGSGGRSITP